MTDYEKDFNHWQNDHSVYSDFTPEPKRSDYDEYGYKPENVVYDGNLVLDKYLVNTYGIEYARKNPREVLRKHTKTIEIQENNKLTEDEVLKIAKAIYKKTLGYQLDKVEITENGVKHYHSDEFLDNYPERRQNPEFTKEEELEALNWVAQMAKTCDKLDNTIYKDKK